MKASSWVVVALAVLLSGAAAFAEDPESAGHAPSDGVLVPVTSKNLQNLHEKKIQRLKAAEAKQAEAEEKQREKDKQAKIDKIQRKTGRSTVSWQVKNR